MKRNSNSKNTVTKNIILKPRAAKRLIKKYDAFKAKNVSKCEQEILSYIQNLMSSLNDQPSIQSGLEAERIIKQVIYTRNDHLFKIKRNLKQCHQEAEVKLTHLKAIGIFEHFRDAYMTLFGPSAHTSSSEPFLTEAVYHYFTNDMPVSCGN